MGSSSVLLTFTCLVFFFSLFFFFFNDTATTEIYTLSLHDALPISRPPARHSSRPHRGTLAFGAGGDASGRGPARRRHRTGTRGGRPPAARARRARPAPEPADGSPGALPERVARADRGPERPPHRGRLAGGDRHPPRAALPGAGGERAHGRAHEATQPPRAGAAIPQGDNARPPSPQAHRVLDGRPRPFQTGQRLLRPPAG